MKLQLPICVYFITLLAIGMYVYLQWVYSFWKRQKVPYIKPSLIFGHLDNPVRRIVHYTSYLNDHYKHFKKQKQKHFGFFLGILPIYVPIENNLIKDILIKNFESFHDRGMYFNEKDNPITSNLVTLRGQAWKTTRAKITHMFTISKIKEMFPMKKHYASEFLQVLENEMSTNKNINFTQLCSGYVMDVTGSNFFGIECNSLHDPNSRFAVEAKKVFKPGFAHLVKYYLALVIPKIITLLKIKMTQESMTNFFSKCVEDIVTYRNENNVFRNDFMQYLIEIYNRNDVDEKLSMMEVKALSLMSFVGAYDTTLSTILFALAELASHQEVQEKLRREIVTAMKNNQNHLSYDVLNQIPYLNLVIKETLRKYPAIPVLLRSCTKEYQVPGTQTILRPGTQVLVPTLAIQNDPEFYEEPEKFIPERFSDQMKSEADKLTFLPFGLGQRNCIGANFASYEIRTLLILLIQNFRLLPPENYVNNFELDPYNLLLHTKENIYFKVERL